MASFSIGGQSSGDFRETSGRVQLYHVVTRDAIGLLTPDAFTQLNPAKVATVAYKSTTLAAITKTGVLGGSVAFTRGDVGNNYIGGPNTTTATAATCKPVGLFINDALGNPFENTPGVGSGRGPFVHGSGTVVGTSIYETKVQTTGVAITYAVGDALYASVNGLLTNVVADAYESTGTVLGIVRAVPDATSSLLVFSFRI